MILLVLIGLLPSAFFSKLKVLSIPGFSYGDHLSHFLVHFQKQTSRVVLVTHFLQEVLIYFLPPIAFN
jgi:hypothetical protein